MCLDGDKDLDMIKERLSTAFRNARESRTILMIWPMCHIALWLLWGAAAFTVLIVIMIQLIQLSEG